jgi:VIT1/CCC1 family predicted Fe2+/Mn2+ transporter
VAAGATVLGDKKRELERKIRARELVFGIQDGLLSTVGLLSGVSAATQSRAIVIVTGVAAGVTGGVSMAAGSYLAAQLGHLSLLLSWAASIATLLAVGVWKGVLTRRPLVRSGLEFAGVALGAAVVGWIVGRLFGVDLVG